MIAPKALLARLHRALPAPAQSLPAVAALELARRRGWLRPPAALDGHGFLLAVDDLGLQIRFRCVDGRFAAGPFDGSAPALTLRANAADYLRLLGGEADTDTLFFQRRLSIGGDTALGLEVKYWLDTVDRPEWLAGLARHLAPGAVASQPGR
ncbi:SCP2 domain-containing protein [Cupriavidus sp. WS]|uniref:ubiquinone anaerobic biosynthesis accessory factor UbiT n=1 Tax=Cupriavidus sp. WS TaxID=1312922 RepID=UPI00036A496D|nr:SCP2 sterol-binding domain-containing protein [Cupriavidus sp. WS]